MTLHQFDLFGTGTPLFDHAHRAPAAPPALFAPQLEAEAQPAPPAPPAPRTTEQSDDLPPMAAALVAGGWLSRYAATIGGGAMAVPAHVQLTGHWALPSRLMQFPCSYAPAQDDAGERIILHHALLCDHPMVQALERAGFTVGGPVLQSDHWRFGILHGEWHHAVDLVSSGHLRDLLDTREFCGRDHIVQAVGYGLDYCKHDGNGGGAHLTVAVARFILAEIGADCPTAPASPDDALRVVGLTENKLDGGRVHRAINWAMGTDKLASVWGRIIGIERGWFRYQGGHLVWTDTACAEQGGTSTRLI